ncbi:hypothetical protein OG828_37015 [Streptomyces sp. NBC_00457]|uniref:hypothetical protein n=1 Tax=Streptomyces sp. NBC_00457 TaxID=2975748 RepID=UPI002E1E3C65
MGTEPDVAARLAAIRRMQRRAERASRRAYLALGMTDPPPLTMWRRIAVVYWKWVRWPFFVWFRHRGVWLFVALGAMYVTVTVVLGFRWVLAARFMLGYADPFAPKGDLHLRPVQQFMAIVLRFAGWLAVPAAVGSAAGLLAAEQKRLLYTRDPESTPTRSRTSRFLLWIFAVITWPIKWVVWPFVWPFVYPFVYLFRCLGRRVGGQSG